MVKNCKMCGQPIKERRLKLAGYCKDCARMARDEGFAKMWTSPKEGWKTVNKMVFGGSDVQKDDVQQRMKDAMTNKKQRRKIERKLQKKVDKGQYTQEEMDAALAQYDAAIGSEQEDQADKAQEQK